jgi:RHS repeat-associated protein
MKKRAIILIAMAVMAAIMMPASLYAGGGSDGGGGGAPATPECESGKSCGGGTDDEGTEGEGDAGAAASAKSSAGGFWSSIGNAISNAFSAIGSAISSFASAVSNFFSGNHSSPQPGDPVLATTGRYVFEETDLDIPGSGFALGRVYRTEGNISGSLGPGWIAPLDSRVIRGTTPVDKDVLAKAASDLASLKTLADMVWESAEAVAIGEEIKAMYVDAAIQYNSLKEVSDRGDSLHRLNGKAWYPGTPAYFEQTGNESLVVMDEGGSPLLFEPAGTGIWLPKSGKERLFTRLESLDGAGAETGAGFVLTGAGGVKKYYAGDGLLSAIEEANGNRVSLTRDGAGRVTKVSGPHGNEWAVTYSGDAISRISGPEGRSVSYGYGGGMLGSATDADGDTVKYAYDAGGRLQRIVKPDGSYIELAYGLDGPGGAKLVSRTRHEEGASEGFDYGAGTTTYTNHSGVWTKYRFDGQHRTIREEHGDGTVKTFSYNGNGLLAAETVNGATTSYQYDSRGNIAEKRYSDGSRERWVWNGIDRAVKYTDRDGVVTDRAYDGKGNLTEERRGGIRVFAARYEGNDRMTESREGGQEPVMYSYDARGWLSGRSVTIGGVTIEESWARDALGRATRYTDGAGREWRYAYGAKTNTETSPAGLEKTWVYNSRKDLTEIRERDTVTGETRATRIAYDRRHLPVEVTDGAGNVTRYEYREDGLMTRKRQGAWTWEYEYEGGGRISAVTQKKDGSGEQYRETYGYSRQGAEEVRSVIRGGTEQTSYRIDAWGRVKAVTNAAGESSERTLSGAGRLSREQGASGGFFAYRYDGAGRLTEAGREGDAAVAATYNADGSIATRTDRNGSVTRYEYDGRGLVAREITGAGEKRYRYDGAGRAIREETITASGIGGGAYYTDWDYDGGDRAVTVTAGGLYPTVWHLNAWGEVTRKADGLGNEQGWAYNGAGQLASAFDGYGKETKYEWNEIGKIARISYPDGSGAEYEYSHLGQAARITDDAGVRWEGAYDEAGRLRKETGRPGIDREYKYDSLGRIVEVKSGGEVTERYAYASRGREATFIDGKGAEYRNEKNAYGELTQETNRLGDRQGYSYDREGRLTEKTGLSGKKAISEYTDALGTVTARYADGTSRVIVRDMAGNIVKATGSTGAISYRYDAGGRLVRVNDEAARETAEYRYDRAGRRIGMQSGNRDVAYGYGKNGELLRVADSIQRLQASYRYDMMGREIERAYGNGVRQETLYDRIGRVILIRETDGRGALLRAEAYLYDGQGRREYSADEKGNVTQYLYDNQSRLQAVLYPWTAEKAEQDKAEAEEAGLYFAAGKGAPERHGFEGAALARLRDLLDRAGPGRGNIISAYQMAWRESFTYDANGNRASKETPWGIIRYGYDAENRLARKGDIVYAYDKDGNLLSEKGARREAEYRYGGQNRMEYSRVTSLAGSNSRAESRYAYDGLGRRTLAQDAGRGAVRTLYDGLGFEAIREGETFSDESFAAWAAAGAVLGGGGEGAGASGTRYRWIGDEDAGDDRTPAAGAEGYAAGQARYAGITATLYGRGEPVGMNRSASGGSRGGAAYLGKDVMGSVRSASDEMGNLESRYEYDAFGKPYLGGLDGGMSLGYTGKPYDSATGLYDYGYRDYAPGLARFTTVDPIRDGSNWFAYVNNDPVNWIDMWGLEPVNTYTITSKYTETKYSNGGRSTVTTTFETTYYSNDSKTITELHGIHEISAAIGQYGSRTTVSPIAETDTKDLPKEVTDRLGPGKVVQENTEKGIKTYSTLSKDSEGKWTSCSD